MQDPTISIDRRSKSFAVFDGWTLVRGFEKYADESVALESARAYVKERTEKEPKVVYPQITSMRVTYSRPRRRKVK